VSHYEQALVLLAGAVAALAYISRQVRKVAKVLEVYGQLPAQVAHWAEVTASNTAAIKSLQAATEALTATQAGGGPG
jgi:hypothetical protein